MKSEISQERPITRLREVSFFTFQFSLLKTFETFITF